jgi:Zn-dependent protease
MSLFLNPAFIIALLIAVSVHEWAHGYVAYRLGDPTAKNEGRLTLNPLAHLDPIGTLVFIIAGFGWGKPVPIDPRYFRNVRRDSALTSLAGPASNFILAWIAFILFLAVSGGSVRGSAMGLLQMQTNGNPFYELIIQVLASSIFVNLVLMAFNLLPIAPLDGSKIIHPFIPAQYEEMYHEFMRRGPIFLVLLLVFEYVVNVPILRSWIFGIMNPILAAMDAAAGLVI